LDKRNAFIHNRRLCSDRLKRCVIALFSVVDSSFIMSQFGDSDEKRPRVHHTHSCVFMWTFTVDLYHKLLATTFTTNFYHQFYHKHLPSNFATNFYHQPLPQTFTVDLYHKRYIQYIQSMYLDNFGTFTIYTYNLGIFMYNLSWPKTLTIDLCHWTSPTTFTLNPYHRPIPLIITIPRSWPKCYRGDTIVNLLLHTCVPMPCKFLVS
jgi:hypothetical protein